MRKSAIVVLVAATASLAACGAARSQETGSQIEITYQVSEFDRLEVAGPYEVEVRTGSPPGVRATGTQADIERLVVDVQDGKLRVRPDKRNEWLTRTGKVRLLVTVPLLRNASVAGSGEIRVDRVHGDSFSGNVAGSGDLAIDQAEVEELRLGVAGSGGVRARSGRARNISFEIAGSGDIDASALQAETAKVSIAGSGNVTGRVSGSADITIAGSGDVEFSGGARCKISKIGSGDVRCS